MIELADIFRRFAPDYLRLHDDTMLPSHRRAIDDILSCRTETMGGHLYQCDTCHSPVFSYHSCKNRSCPKCHGEQTELWLELRRQEMLPVPYFHLTITVPESLRPLFRAHQKDLYHLFMQTCTAAILKMAKDSRHLGAMVGILMVLHTWTQQLIYHPHLHCLVTGGGVNDNGTWQPARKKFLFPLRAFSRLVRGKFMDCLKQKRPDFILPATAWKQQWVTHCSPWGQGEQAVLDYLGRYVFRVAINNSRIVAMDDDSVTFLYKDRKKNKKRTCRLRGEEFMRRFLQHVLPRGFHKIRYGGLWHPARRALAQKIRESLPPGKSTMLTESSATEENPTPEKGSPRIATGSPCPCCASGRLIMVRRIPKPRLPPLARSP
ncbi:MAG: IS91 family transposase [Magnetococcales bacterium]|nr:IS91 family transposase [Magnetococcales bacterium]